MTADGKIDKPCSAHGNTPAVAIAEVQVVIGMWLDSAREHGHPIPEARYCSAIYAA